MPQRSHSVPAAPTAPLSRPGEAEGAGGILTIDLAAIVENYRILMAHAEGAEVLAVVKADAYGLGVAKVAPALVAAGCRQVCVALAEEGLALRRVLGRGTGIVVFHGFMPGKERDCIEAGLVPVLNSLDQMEAWSAAARRLGRALPAILQIDSGMARFGLSEADCGRIVEGGMLDGVSVALVMSHLANADEPGHPGNAAQREAFDDLRRRLPPAPASLAASSGIFLGSAFHYDAVRPGAALYGIAPQPGAPNPMRPVIRLQGRIAQIRDVPAGMPVGYGWTARTERPSRLATVAAGYADGFLRSLSNRAAAWCEGWRLPLVGRVSMDSIVIDLTEAPPDFLAPGALVDLIGPDQDVDALAAAAGTIGYEVLTALGRRYDRRYID